MKPMKPRKDKSETNENLDLALDFLIIFLILFGSSFEFFGLETDESETDESETDANWDLALQLVGMFAKFSISLRILGVGSAARAREGNWAPHSVTIKS